MSHNESLLPEQQEKLASFKEITQYDDNDHQKILDLLQHTSWNLEIAIQRFFENNFDFEPVETRPTSSLDGNNSSTDIGSGSNNSRTRLTQFDDATLSQFDLLPKFPKANKLAGHWKFTPGISTSESASSSDMKNNGLSALQPLLFVLLLIPKTLLFVLLKLNEVLRTLFPGLYDLWKQDTNAFPSKPLYLPKALLPEKPSNGLEPEDLAKYQDFDFKARLQEIIKEPTDLPIFEGEFNDAYDSAKSELKFLLLILINDTKSSNLFLKHFINSRDFKTMVTDKYGNRADNFLIWGGNVDYMEGYLVGSKYNISRTPYIALISNVSTYGETFPTMSLIKYAQAFNFEHVPDDDLTTVKQRLKKVIKMFKKIASHYVIQLIDQKIDQDEKNYERLMKQQQDDAYLRSLEQDRVKKHQRQLVEKKKLLKKRKYLEKLQQDQLFLNSLKKELFNWKTIFEHDDSKGEAVDLDGNLLEKGLYCLIQFRLPDGERFKQKLPKSFSLNNIYLFVQLKLLLKALKDQGLYGSHLWDTVESTITKNKAELLDQSKFCYKFELISSFPKFKVSSDPEAKIANTKQLLPNCNLLVEYDLDYKEQLSYLVLHFNKTSEVFRAEEVPDEKIEDISSDEE